MCRLGVDAAAEGCEFPSRLRHRSRSKWSQLGSSTVVAVAIVSLLFVGASQGLVAHSSGLRRWQRSSPAFSSPLSYPDSAGKICSYRHERFLPRCSHSVDDGCHDTKTVHTLLIDNYDSYTYNLFQQLAVTNGRAPFVVYNDDEGGDLWKAIGRMGRVPDNIVISPGPGRPDVAADFGMCAQALREATDIPILGVCLGHEGLGIAYGARVIRAREPMHGRLSPVFHNEDPLFRGVPQGANVVRYHSLVVDEATLLPEGPLEATAWTEDGVLMAMKHNKYPHWGLQFHPESVGTKYGSDIVRNFRELTVDWARQAPCKKGLFSEGVVGGEMATNGFVRNGALRTEKRADRDGPGTYSSFLGAEQSAEILKPVEETVASSPPRDSTARQRPFVLYVQEVSMNGGVDFGGKSNPAGDRTIPTAMPDTELAFRALFGDDPTAWWLDSSSLRSGRAADGQAKARFTFMGGADGPLSEIIECYGGDRLIVQCKKDGEGGGTGKRREMSANILDYLKTKMAKMGNEYGLSAEHNSLDVRTVEEERRDKRGNNAGGHIDGSSDVEKSSGRPAVLPFEFMGGFVGFLGYELRHEANDVLKRSAGGTEWSWQPPGGGQLENAILDSKVAGDPEELTPSATKSTPEMEGQTGIASLVGRDVPLGLFVFVDRFVAFDHQDGKAYVLALVHKTSGGQDVGIIDDRKHDHGEIGAVSSDPKIEALAWIRRTAQSLRSISLPDQDNEMSSKSDGRSPSPPANGEAVAARSETSVACAMDIPRSQYERSLSEIMRLVEEGETYEVCLTNQIVCERPGKGLTLPLDLYSRLRSSNPAPYAAYIVHDPHRRLSPETPDQLSAEGETGPAFAVCCSSPERFMKVDRHGLVESKPIKGTVRRGKTPAEDLALATDLGKGEKNMAENLMIVDLVRNDLGRVCQTGTVNVPKLMHVESYATVHQLVSTIRGQLRPGCGALDAIAAAFPGGSMTGAPKQRTMEIIDRLELGRPRGVYSGSIGFLSVDGAADFNIVIRTAVVTPQNVTVGAGGAVIALSEVDDEYEEMLLKATSVLGAIGYKQTPGQQGPPGSEPLTSEAKIASEFRVFEDPVEAIKEQGKIFTRNEPINSRHSVLRPTGCDVAEQRAPQA